MWKNWLLVTLVHFIFLKKTTVSAAWGKMLEILSSKVLVSTLFYLRPIGIEINQVQNIVKMPEFP